VTGVNAEEPSATGDTPGGVSMTTSYAPERSVGGESGRRVEPTDRRDLDGVPTGRHRRPDRERPSRRNLGRRRRHAAPAALRTVNLAARFDHAVSPEGGRTCTDRTPSRTSTAKTSRSPDRSMLPRTMPVLGTTVAAEALSG
jgi:hypothetical protein